MSNGIDDPKVNWMAHASGAVLGIVLALLLYGIPKLRKINAGTDETDGQIGGMGA